MCNNSILKLLTFLILIPLVGCSIYKDEGIDGKRVPIKNVGYLIQTEKKLTEKDDGERADDEYKGSSRGDHQEYYDFDTYDKPVHYYQEAKPKEIFADKKSAHHKPKKSRGTKLYKKIVRVVPVEYESNKQNSVNISNKLPSNNVDTKVSAPASNVVAKSGLVRIVRKPDGSVTPSPMQQQVPVKQNSNVVQTNNNAVQSNASQQQSANNVGNVADTQYPMDPIVLPNNNTSSQLKPNANVVQNNAPQQQPSNNVGNVATTQHPMDSVVLPNNTSSQLKQNANVVQNNAPQQKPANNVGNVATTQYPMDSVVLPNNNTKSQSSMDDIESLFERKVKKEFQSAKKGGSGSNVNNQSSDNSNASGTDDPENRPIPLPFN